MNKSKIALALLLIGLTFGLWYFGFRSGDGSKFDTSPYVALGIGVAEETSRVIANQGRVIVLAPDTKEFLNPAIDGQLRAFEKTLGKKQNVSLAPPVRFTLSPMERMATGGAVTRETFLGALHAKPIQAVVLFCAFPALTDADFDAIKQSGAKIVVASGYLPVYRSLLELRAIDVVVVPRPDRPDKPVAKATPLETFQEHFLVVTPETLSRLPQ